MASLNNGNRFRRDSWSKQNLTHFAILIKVEKSIFELEVQKVRFFFYVGRAKITY